MRISSGHVGQDLRHDAVMSLALLYGDSGRLGSDKVAVMQTVLHDGNSNTVVLRGTAEHFSFSCNHQAQELCVIKPHQVMA